MSLSDDEFNENARRFLLDSQIVRTLTSFEDAPLVAPVEKNNPNYYIELYAYNASRRVDDLCRVMMKIPSMLGLLEAEPAIAKIPILLDDTDKTSNRLAYYDALANTAYLNPRILAEVQDVLMTEAHSAEFKEVITVGHELRHGFQEARRLMQLPRDFPPKFKGIYEVLLNRVVEADANAFTGVMATEVALAPELVGADMINLLDEAEALPFKETLDAYSAAVSKDGRNHYNGAAASAAFDAMFAPENGEYLQGYDTAMSRHLSKYDPVRIDSLDWADFVTDKASWNAFKSHIQGFSVMSWDDDGHVIERKSYDAPSRLDFKTAIQGLNAETLRDCGFKPSTFPVSASLSPALP